MSTFAEIAVKAHRLIPIYGTGGQIGEDPRMRLVAELADALTKLEHDLNEHKHQYLATSTNYMHGVNNYLAYTQEPTVAEVADANLR